MGVHRGGELAFTPWKFGLRIKSF